MTGDQMVGGGERTEQNQTDKCKLGEREMKQMSKTLVRRQRYEIQRDQRDIKDGGEFRYNHGTSSRVEANMRARTAALEALATIQ